MGSRRGLRARSRLPGRHDFLWFGLSPPAAPVGIVGIDFRMIRREPTGEMGAIDREASIVGGILETCVDQTGLDDALLDLGRAVGPSSP